MKYWPALLLFVGIAAWMFFSARTPTGEEDLYSIVNLEQYQNALKRVEELTLQPILDSDQGKELTSEQTKGLKDSVGLIKKMIAFEPTNFGPYVMLAKTQRALGQAEEAARNYKQAILLFPQEFKDSETLWTAAEVHYDLGTLYYNNSDYQKAEEHATQAVMLVMDNPKYLAGLAAIQAQLGKLEEARQLVDQALKIDPTHPVAKELDTELKNVGA